MTAENTVFVMSVSWQTEIDSYCPVSYFDWFYVAKRVDRPRCREARGLRGIGSVRGVSPQGQNSDWQQDCGRPERAGVDGRKSAGPFGMNGGSPGRRSRTAVGSSEAKGLCYRRHYWAPCRAEPQRHGPPAMAITDLNAWKKRAHPESWKVPLAESGPLLSEETA